jgi:hypothetical protein
MYKTRLSSWNICKNIKRKDWQGFAVMRHRREASGRPFGRAEIHGKIKSDKDFRDYLKLQNVSEDDFVREAIQSIKSVPAHILYQDSPLSPVGASSIRTSRAESEMYADQSQNVKATHETISMDPFLLGGGAPLVPIHLPAVSSAVSHFEQQITGVIDAKEQEAPSSKSVTSDTPEPYGGPSIHRILPLQEQATFQGGLTYGATFNGDSRLLGDVPSNQPYPVFRTPYTMELPNYLSQAIEPESGVMPVRPPFSDFGGLLGQILGPGFQDAAAGNFGDETGVYHAFMSDAMMASISAASKEFSICGQWLEKASLGLQHMCNSGNHVQLVTLTTLLVWLQVHDQRSADGSIGIAESMMREFSRTASHVLGEDDPVCLILEWMKAVAGKKLAECRVTSDMLEQVWAGYKNDLGCQHPNSIVALYCLSFHLININKEYPEAEARLRLAHEASVQVFGSSHLMSLNILATLSRAQSRQCNLVGALETIRRCVGEEPLGQHHPHRLMLLLRMAIICGRLRMLKEREELYRIVVEGRAATLGAHHETTKSAYKSLVQILQDAGKWDSAKEQVEKYMSEPHLAVSRYETWWCRTVEQSQNSRGRRSASEETD